MIHAMLRGQQKNQRGNQAVQTQSNQQKGGNLQVQNQKRTVCQKIPGGNLQAQNQIKGQSRKKKK